MGWGDTILSGLGGGEYKGPNGGWGAELGGGGGGGGG